MPSAALSTRCALHFCSGVYNDIILAWSAFRDYLIREGIELSTLDLTRILEDDLERTMDAADMLEAQLAVSELIKQVAGIAALRRLQVLQAVDRKLGELESIKRPAYAFVKRTLHSTYSAVSVISGTGCSVRMRERLKQGLEQHLDTIRNHIYHLILSAVGDLQEFCNDSMSGFAEEASREVCRSLEYMEGGFQHADHRAIEARHRTVEGAVAALPAP